MQPADSIDRLPKDIIGYKIFLDIVPSEVFKWCKLNKSFRSLCNKDEYWKLYYEKWVGDYTIVEKTPEMTWRQMFIRNYHSYVTIEDPYLIWFNTATSNTMINISPDDTNVILVPARRIGKNKFVYYPFFYQYRFSYPYNKSLQALKGITSRVKTSGKFPTSYVKHLLFNYHNSEGDNDEIILPRRDMAIDDIPDLYTFR